MLNRSPPIAGKKLKNKMKNLTKIQIDSANSGGTFLWNGETYRISNNNQRDNDSLLVLDGVGENRGCCLIIEAWRPRRGCKSALEPGVSAAEALGLLVSAAQNECVPWGNQ